MYFRDPPPGPPPEPPSRSRLPDWMGPPPGELATVVAIEHPVVRGEGIALRATHVAVHATGLLLHLGMVLADDDVHGRLFDRLHGPADDPGGLRIGVDLGRQGFGDSAARAPAAAGPPWDRPPPDHPVVRPRSRGSGGRHDYRTESWIWPLPEAEMALVVRWTDHGIGETRIDLPAARIRAAAGRTVRPFGDLPADEHPADGPPATELD